MSNKLTRNCIKCKKNQKKLLLLDSMGALFSVLALIFVKKFEPIFGLNDEIFNLLFPIPIVFCIYSLVAYLFSKNKWKLFLRGIALANLSYCFLTISIIIIHFKKLTILGIGYFVLEIVIIVILALYELRVSTIKLAH